MNDDIKDMMQHLDEAKNNKSKSKRDQSQTNFPRKHTGSDSASMLDTSASGETVPDPVNQLYLAPASKKNSSPAFSRFSKTVLNKVDPSELLRSDKSDAERFWGFQPGGKLESTWRRMSNNDYILFYTGWGLYTLGVRLVGRERNRRLAEALWPDYRDTSGGTDNDNKQPYEYLLYLADPLPINLPAKDLHTYLGYSNNYVSGFTRAKPHGVRKIVFDHGSVRNFLKQYTR